MKKDEAVFNSVVIGLLVGGLSSFVYWLLLLVYDWKIWKSWCVGWWFIDSVFLGGFFVLLSCMCTRKKCPDYLWCAINVGFVLNIIFGISKNVFVFEFITDKISQLWMSILLTIYSIICFALSENQNTASSNKESFRDGMKEMESAENKSFIDSFSEEINAAENDKAKSTLDEKTARWNQHNKEARIRREKQIKEEKKKRQENDLASKKRQDQINAEKKRQSEIDRVFGIQKELEEGENN
jgi:hypothetical protein